jgi:hypothetical protein
MTDVFSSRHYQQHNQRRLEHLASLKLDLYGKSVLEVGAGTGDLTSFFLDRKCEVTAIDGRPENVALLSDHHPSVHTACLDLDPPDEDHPLFDEHYDVLFCYGLLYHLSKPHGLLNVICPLANICLLETCVSAGQLDELNPCKEDGSIASQSLNSLGCRPTRYWVYHQLRRYYQHVYTCYTQPSHKEFPLNWRNLDSTLTLSRAVFVAANTPIDCPDLLEGIVHEHRPV